MFEQLIATGKLAHRKHDNPPQHGFFDQIYEGDRRLSEDLSFFHRWRTLCGGEIWAILDEQIGHVGEFTYQGRFADLLPRPAVRIAG